MDFSTMEDTALQVWSDAGTLFETEIFGVNIGLIFAAIAVLVVCLILPGLLARLISKSVMSATDEDRRFHYKGLMKAIRAPLRVLPLVVGAVVAHEYVEDGSTLHWVLGNVARSLLIIMLFWALYRAVDPIVGLCSNLRQRFSGPLVDWAAKTSKIVLAFLGVTAVLEAWGVNVAGLLAGLGLVGVAVALGAQDLFKSLISGLRILAERRFENGDWIEVDGVIEGTVIEIGFRSTSIRRFDLSPVYVPNTKLSDNALTNFSRMPQRRIYWSIAVEYRTSIDQLREIRDGIESYLVGNDEFVQPDQGTLFVRVNDFSDSAIDILVYCFTNTTDWGEWLEIRERFAYHIKEVVEGAGSGFAFPSRSIYIEKDDSKDEAPQENGGDDRDGDRSKPERYSPPSSLKDAQRRDQPGTTSTEQNEAGGEEEGE